MAVDIGMAEGTGMAECTRMASGMAEDTAEIAKSNGMPSGMATSIGMYEATEMTEAIVMAGAC
jgi:hypothetical protein